MVVAARALPCWCRDVGGGGGAGRQGHSVLLQHESLLGSGPRQPREASGRGSLRLAALGLICSLVFLAGFCSFKNLNLRS